MTTIAKLTGVSAAYDDRAVLHDVDFALQSGEVVAILGANGSGKSTLVKTMLRSTHVTEGSVELFGVPAADFRQWSRIGYVPQRLTPGGGLPVTVREVVASGRLSSLRRFRPARPADRAAIAAAIEVVDLGELVSLPMAHLSGGQQRRALIARALAGEPDVLIMDEPMAGVDAANQRLLADSLTRLVGRGVTILVVAHELGPLAPLITRVVSVTDGRIVYDGPPGQIAGDWQHGDIEAHPHAHDESRARPSGLGLLG